MKNYYDKKKQKKFNKDKSINLSSQVQPPIINQSLKNNQIFLNPQQHLNSSLQSSIINSNNQETNLLNKQSSTIQSICDETQNNFSKSYVPEIEKKFKFSSTDNSTQLQQKDDFYVKSKNNMDKFYQSLQNEKKDKKKQSTILLSTLQSINTTQQEQDIQTYQQCLNNISQKYQQKFDTGRSFLETQKLSSYHLDDFSESLNASMRSQSVLQIQSPQNESIRSLIPPKLYQSSKKIETDKEKQNSENQFQDQIDLNDNQFLTQSIKINQEISHITSQQINSSKLDSFQSKQISKIKDLISESCQKEIEMDIEKYYQQQNLNYDSFQQNINTKHIRLFQNDNKLRKYTIKEVIQEDMNNFGLGIGIYFEFLKKLKFLFLLFFFLSFPQLITSSRQFYKSDYTNSFSEEAEVGNRSFYNFLLSTTLGGSVIGYKRCQYFDLSYNSTENMAQLTCPEDFIFNFQSLYFGIIDSESQQQFSQCEDIENYLLATQYNNITFQNAFYQKCDQAQSCKFTKEEMISLYQEQYQTDIQYSNVSAYISGYCEKQPYRSFRNNLFLFELSKIVIFFAFIQYIKRKDLEKQVQYKKEKVDLSKFTVLIKDFKANGQNQNDLYINLKEFFEYNIQLYNYKQYLKTKAKLERKKLNNFQAFQYQISKSVKQIRKLNSLIKKNIQKRYASPQASQQKSQIVDKKKQQQQINNKNNNNPQAIKIEDFETVQENIINNHSSCQKNLNEKQKKSNKQNIQIEDNNLNNTNSNSKQSSYTEQLNKINLKLEKLVTETPENEKELIKLTVQNFKVQLVDINFSPNPTILHYKQQINKLQKKKRRKIVEFHLKYINKQTQGEDKNTQKFTKINKKVSLKNLKSYIDKNEKELKQQEKKCSKSKMLAQMKSNFKELQKIKSEIKKLQLKLDQYMLQQNNQTYKEVYATFETINQTDQVLKLYQISRFQRFLHFISFYLFTGEFRFFNNQFIYVHNATNPDNIIWENLYYGKTSIFFRRLFVCISVLTIIDLSTYICVILMYLKYMASMKLQHMEVQQKKADSICQILQFIPYLIGLGIICSNYLISLLVKSVSKFQKFKNKNEELLSSSRAIFAFQLINTLIILFVIGIDFNLSINYEDDFITSLLLSGAYVELTPQWYKQAGVQIIIFTILSAIGYPVRYIGLKSLRYLRQYYDRKFTQCPHITRQKTNKQWINIYTGPQFDLSYRYSSVYIQIILTLLFGPGMPILYIISFFYCLCLFWAEKYWLITECQKPRNIDMLIQKQMRVILIVAVLLNCLLCIYIYGCSEIMTNQIDNDNEISKMKFIVAVHTPLTFYQRFYYYITEKQTPKNFFTIIIIISIILGFQRLLQYIKTACKSCFIKSSNVLDNKFKNKRQQNIQLYAILSKYQLQEVQAQFQMEFWRCQSNDLLQKFYQQNIKDIGLVLELKNNFLISLQNPGNLTTPLENKSNNSNNKSDTQSQQIQKKPQTITYNNEGLYSENKLQSMIIQNISQQYNNINRQRKRKSTQQQQQNLNQEIQEEEEEQKIQFQKYNQNLEQLQTNLFNFIGLPSYNINLNPKYKYLQELLLWELELIQQSTSNLNKQEENNKEQTILQKI